MSLALLVEILQHCVTSEISVQLSVPQQLFSVRPHGFLFKHGGFKIWPSV